MTARYCKISILPRSMTSTCWKYWKPSDIMLETTSLPAPVPLQHQRDHDTPPPPLHVLVVDDLATVRHVIVALLKALGHAQISEAQNGEQALALLRAGTAAMPVNFVITDWQMPVMDGLALLKAIRTSADWRDVPVLMVTSVAEHDNIMAATRAGADGYLVKPALNAVVFQQALNAILLKRGRAG